MVIAFLMMNPFHHKLYKGEYNEGGEYNGYVAFDGELPMSCQGGGSWYNYDDSLDNMVSVHGGITFDNPMSALLKEPIIPLTPIPDRDTLKTLRCIGFDTLHCDDTREKWTMEATEKETLNLKAQIEKLLKDGNEHK
jgi:hypothetical protein